MITGFQPLPGGSGQQFLRGNAILFSASIIMYLKSNGNYSTVYLYDQSQHIVTKTLKQCELILDQDLFIRCHKNYLINIKYLLSRNIYKSNKLILKEGVNIPISRRKRPLVNKILKGKNTV